MTLSKEDKKWATERPREEVVNKYSNKGKGELRESIFVDDKPYFIRYSKQKNLLYVEPVIQEERRKLRPPHLEECPYIPYDFKKPGNPNQYLQRAMQEAADSLIQKIKSMIIKLNDTDDQTANMLTLTIFSSYFHDRFSSIYNLIVAGANGTGKSVFGDTFECLGYRPVKVTDMTDAFWFRIFGTTEFGQVTIIAEEYDRIDESSKTMAVLKEGYQPNSKVPRMTSDYSKMEFFCPFGFKIIIAEKSPDENKARGLIDRSFKIKTYKGYPECKIKEIRNSQGNSKRQKVYDEIMDLRNLLLVYRLLHFQDPYKEIDIGLDGRDEELCKPTLELLYSLGASEETLKMAECTFQHFLDSKNRRKGQSIDAVLYPIVVNAVAQYGLDTIDNCKSISTSDVWGEIIKQLDGTHDLNPSIFHSENFGKLYRPTVIHMICDKFGAEQDHKEKGNNLIFDMRKLSRMQKIYGNNGKIKVKPDSLIHKSRLEGKPTIVNQDNVNEINEKRRGQEPESYYASSSLSTKSESVNQPTINNKEVNPEKVKCPTCDYVEYPFWMKLHQCENKDKDTNN
jgi:hypothetical protein